MIRTFAAVIFAAIIMLVSPAGFAAPLTRAQAVSVLFSSSSGVSIDTNRSVVWCPALDFGTGFPGLLPAGWMVDPQERGWRPFPGTSVSVPRPSYFLWIDDLPAAEFQHLTRFVLLDANAVNPTVANGGILVSTQGWWPVIRWPDGNRQAFFSTTQERVSNQPPGAENERGLIAGTVPSSADVPGTPLIPDRSRAASSASNACGLIVLGSADVHMRHGAVACEGDLISHYGISADRVIKANSGYPATARDLAAAITNLLELQPPCDQIYVRLISHGSVGGLRLADGILSTTNLAIQLKRLAAKQVPVHLLINACYGASLIETHRWDFPAGSTILTSADANQVCWGGVFPDGAFSLYVNAFSRALNSDPSAQIDDTGAHTQVVSQKPGYIWTNGVVCYPAGPPAGSAGDNPNPQLTSIGSDPTVINLNVSNGTGAVRTNFLLFFQGDVTDGLARAWRSDASDTLGAPWASNSTTISYNAETDETMVRWAAANSPALPNEYIHFGYARAQAGLKPRRQKWGFAAISPVPEDRVPMHESSLRQGEDGRTATLRLASRRAADGGWGEPVQGVLIYRISPAPILLERLAQSDPAVAALSENFVGPFTLLPDQPLEYVIEIPVVPPDSSPTLILEEHLFWEYNQNRTDLLQQFQLRPPVVLRPTLTWQKYGFDTLVLTWDIPTAILQEALDPAGPWSDLPAATSPHFEQMALETPTKFFRLFKPSPTL